MMRRKRCELAEPRRYAPVSKGKVQDYLLQKQKTEKLASFMLANAKQYKKALTEETGFNFDDKRYPKYHKETLEEMGYI